MEVTKKPDLPDNDRANRKHSLKKNFINILFLFQQFHWHFEMTCMKSFFVCIIFTNRIKSAIRLVLMHSTKNRKIFLNVLNIDFSLEEEL